ncbi:hypothetical protein [Nocardioides aquiterrae]|uniref:Head-to-tail adaptor n=1 Tax=Nocardioides aquiterrae TaxID=203799 RepID=A0ABN1UC29_9ACTN
MAGLEDYVTIDAAAVAEGWRTLTEEQAAAAESLIDRAIPILVSQSPGLLDRLEAATTPPEAVEQVLVQAVRRALQPTFNPDGAKSISKTLEGEYSETVTWDTRALQGGLYFHASELALLAGPARKGRGKAFAINQTPRY